MKLRINFKKYPTLYKRNVNGSVQTWFLDANLKTGEYRATSGQLNGKKTTSTWKKVHSKNVGRSNETSESEQVQKECAACYTKKIEQGGYFHKLEDIPIERPFSPMLAEKYVKGRIDIPWPITYAQPKLDGVRCNISLAKGMLSRRGKKIISAPHILSQLAQILRKHPNVTFDGEIYAHALKDNFDRLIGLAKKTKPTPADLEESAAELEYHIYDAYFSDAPDMTFVDRRARIEEILRPFYGIIRCILLVQTVPCKTMEELDELYAMWLEQGYEGQMLRNPNSKYWFQRVWDLMKRKTFIDGEFKLIEILEGKGNKVGKAGKIRVYTRNGKTSKAGMRGNHPFLRKLWLDWCTNPKKYVGKKVTVRYQGFTKDDAFRFGVMIKMQKDI
jgi:ATP-dependent DNA ligase